MAFQARRGGRLEDATMENRFRALEDFLHERFGVDAANLDVLGNVGAVGDGTGGGAAGTAPSGGLGSGAVGTMGGDVTGPASACTVIQVQGQSFGAGSVSGQVPTYDGTSAWVATAPTTPTLTTLTLLGAWTQADCSALAGADAEILNSFATVALSSPMPVAGTLVGLVVKLTGDVGAAGNDVITTVYKNGVATTLTATITGAGATENEVVATVTPVAFVAGDDITVEMKKNGTPAAVRAVATVWGRFSG